VHVERERERERNYKKLVHMITEAEKFQYLQLARILRKVDGIISF
jgi:hypothetical protein